MKKKITLSDIERNYGFTLKDNHLFDLLFTDKEKTILEKEIIAFYGNFYHPDLKPSHFTALLQMNRLIGGRFLEKIPEYGGNGVNKIYKNLTIEKIKLKILNSVQSTLFPKQL